MKDSGSQDETFQLAEHLPAMVVLAAYLLLPVFMLPLAGNWSWPGAWIMIAINLAFGIGSRLMAVKRTPGILAERSRSLAAADTKAWDKVLVRFIVLFGPIALWLVAGLDKRWSWSLQSGAASLLAGTILALLGYALASWALVSNPFFSGTVRLQRDRGHHVIDSGPYAWLRHPGYAGAILSYLGLPLLLDSWWAYLPVVITSIVLVIRTALEDRTLGLELEGYPQYQQRVKYRLLPFIW